MGLLLEKLTRQIIGAAIDVHRALGPGLLESAYEACLAYELRDRKIRVERQVPIEVLYKGVELDVGYRMDLLVENQVILELKCVTQITGIDRAQLLTYLRLANKPVGLIVNFNVVLLTDGIVRQALTTAAR